MREALKALEHPGMIDPLGFGPVRDAFSDALFPGISTVQTRARYFLFVPWLCQALDRSSANEGNAARRLREMEIDLLDRLDQGTAASVTGVIGRTSQRGPNMQLPSAVYWGGLETLGIRGFVGSRRDYERSVVERRRKRRSRRDAEAGPLEAEWHGALPAPPDLSAPLDLTAMEADEARFLSERITTGPATRDSLLAACVQGPESDLEDAPWSGSLAVRSGTANQAILRHAELFSLVAWGANLRYNALLIGEYERDGKDAPGAVEVRQQQWLDEMNERRADLIGWCDDLERMWAVVASQRPRARRRSGAFVEWWIRTAIADPVFAMASPQVADRLAHRELQLKPGRARLSDHRCRRTDEGLQGDERMHFRWAQARTIAGDIVRALT